MADAEGQADETTPIRPGVLSYCKRIRDPNATAASQTMPSKAVTKIFLRMELRTRADHLPVTKQPPFHPAEDYRGKITCSKSERYEPISRKTPSSFWNSTGLVRW